jgi:hypothetical protein
VVYSYDLATNKVGSWGPAGGGMWGRQGPAISSDGTMYTGTGDGRWDPENGIYGNGIIEVKQNPETKALDLVDYYGPSNAEWLVKRDLDMQVTPVIFNYKGRELMADAGKECRLYLMDTKAIGGDDHRTPEYRSPLYCNEEVNIASAGVWGSLASWEDTRVPGGCCLRFGDRSIRPSKRRLRMARRSTVALRLSRWKRGLAS